MRHPRRCSGARPAPCPGRDRLRVPAGRTGGRGVEAASVAVRDGSVRGGDQRSPSPLDATTMPRMLRATTKPLTSTAGRATAYFRASPVSHDLPRTTADHLDQGASALANAIATRLLLAPGRPHQSTPAEWRPEPLPGLKDVRSDCPGKNPTKFVSRTDASWRH